MHHIITQIIVDYCYFSIYSDILQELQTVCISTNNTAYKCQHYQIMH